MIFGKHGGLQKLAKTTILAITVFTRPTLLGGADETTNGTNQSPATPPPTSTTDAKWGKI